MFEPVPKSYDVPALEREVMAFWEREEVERRYLERNAAAEEIYSFLDGPITANGPMGVHHALGRTYKDLWQRYNTMLGKRQRYQNGFDCQGLWVEVTVERELGFTSKRDIERYGIAEFVRKCKQSVFTFSDLQTSQSRRLGYFMDWPNSYFTMSDENNYSIWHFLKTCHSRGLLYKGHDVMPWCSRCGTGISQTEAAEGYKELSHESVFVAFPLSDRPGESLLVWTTTPWTLTSNVAVAVNPDLTYLKVLQADRVYYVAQGALAVIRGEREVLEELSGTELLGLGYAGPFDELPAEREVRHVVIPWDEVSEAEGTGLVHIAPGCGQEDFALSKDHDLAVVAPLDQNGTYLDGFGWLTGRSVLEVTPDIVEDLRRKGILYRAERYTHSYPTCWRCGTELVFRLVDEWFISMDPLREPMAEVVRQIRWLPPFGLDRELDWLRNMSDWMISKKRYWGLALPFWICPDGHLTVIGSKEELVERAVSGLEHLESPHRPWIDEVRIRCSDCEAEAERIADVGNPWLDAGIVSYSTLKYTSDRAYWEAWFPADFITESFPGQFRNWFYSLLAMSTVLEDRPPFLTVLGYGLVRDENGREMHKSWGNLIPFDEAADRSGADIMRWLFCLHNPEANLGFGWSALDEAKRRLLVLWNTYSFFVTYARLDGWTPGSQVPEPASRPILDRWILARLNETVGTVRNRLDDYDAMHAARAIERLIDDLSTWYVRRSRARFWKAENDSDKAAAYATLYACLTTLTRLMAPFMPFTTEALYQNLVRNIDATAEVSVHLTDFPSTDAALEDAELLRAMEVAREIVALGRAARERANLRVRQPLARIFVRVPDRAAEDALRSVDAIVLEELNVQGLDVVREAQEFVQYAVRPNLPVLGPRFGKRLPALRTALEALPSSRVAATVEAGGTVQVLVDGEAVELGPAEILVTAREQEGFAAMAADGYLVALDTRITPELLSLGWAREVIRRVNDWRKEAGFNVEDHIEIRYESTPELARSLAEHGSYVCRETLADLLCDASPLGTGFVGTAEFEGQRLVAELVRSA